METPAPRRLNVLVSSVFEELKEYRAAAIDAIWRCDLYPIGMERQNIALPYSTSASSKEMVKESDVYIGLFSQRLGTITEQELQWAEEFNQPIFVFISSKPLNDEDRAPDQRSDEAAGKSHRRPQAKVCRDHV